MDNASLVLDPANLAALAVAQPLNFSGNLVKHSLKIHHSHRDVLNRKRRTGLSRHRLLELDPLATDEKPYAK